MNKKIQNSLPNLLTISRILILPLLILCFFMSDKWSRWPVVFIFSFASLTDFLDGYLARSWSAQSKFGTFLDPLADKIIVVVTIIMLIYFSTIDKFSIIPATIIICREILISGLREFVAEKNKGIDVSKVAKAKTATQMISLLILIIDTGSFIRCVGASLLWISALLSLYSAFKYFSKHFSVFN